MSLENKIPPALSTENETRYEMLRLQEHVWRKIGFRKHLVGKAGVATAVRRSISGWPTRTDRVSMAYPKEQAALHQYVMAGMPGQGDRPDQYGFIWAAILSLVISQIIKVLLEWWLENRTNQEWMTQMQTLPGEKT
jgi:hypothetical protein